ncbi:hypothetical protein OB953_13180 [Aeromonas salmonicida]|uniref:hypothetical protein n=1 Tax=Aeromonas salmonicida TaxID=645 RepID=UPI00259D6834|nr:hypothetical protein [Aeromonas salmonicida]MDM5136538.1 hypothetical protein [Aeromonas salmonicida]
MLAIGWAFSSMGGRINSLRDELATANETINALQTANDQMATEFQTLQREDRGLRTLLAHQNAALTELDQQQRKTADDLQHALATPPAGRPDCAREPLPVGALRLLQPAKGRGANTGGEAAATAGAGAPLPGA